MKVKLYVEGGGDSKSLHIKCREGFRKLLERAGLQGRMPAIKACGGRNAAYDDFKTAQARSLRKNQELPMLLVDSEGPVTSSSPWTHLAGSDHWKKPSGALDDQAQLMVQCMETWCAADRAALRAFFGAALVESALPSHVNLEAASKDDVQTALVNATRPCGRKRQYQKGQRSFELLGRLDPAVFKSCLPAFKRLIDTLDQYL